MEISLNQTRKRINLKQTAKGDLYYDLTVELFNATNEETVKELMALKYQVEQAIPSVKKK